MSKKMSGATAPKPTPGPDAPIAGVPGLPPAVIDRLIGAGVRTLGDLRPLVESKAAVDATVEPVGGVLTDLGEGLTLFDKYRAQDALRALLGGRSHMLKLMASWPRPAATKADLAAAPGPDDFDEHTPPPKGRPRGEPVARYVVLPPGEPVVELFKQWDRDGRIPAGCVLAEHVRAGFVLLAGEVAGVKTGRPVPGPALDGFVVRAGVRQSGGRFPEVPRQFVVFAPRVR